MSNKIHIVCLDAPAPPDYGGAIDMYYKIEALAQKGFEIVLHYFDYKSNRGIGDLKNYCKEIYAYPRKNILKSLSLNTPYMVASRINQHLIDRLNSDDAPIIIEGIHCTGILPFISNNKRKVVVRMHNDEALYYSHLANTEKRVFKKLYFTLESKLSAAYQQRLSKDLVFAFLSETDAEIFQKKYDVKESRFIPCFTAWQNVNGKEGQGNYCLYHGNLSIAENSKAALWLVEKVFSKCSAPFIIAGKSPSKELYQAASKYPHVRVISDPTNPALDRLIEDAHIHILPSFNATGVKLKLLHALACGRFCLTNNAGVAGSGLEDEVLLAGNAEEFIVNIEILMSRMFTEGDIKKRKLHMQLYNNISNAEKLSALL